jgi:hypothetical protein
MPLCFQTVFGAESRTCATFRNRGGNKRREIVAEIKKLTKAWDKQQAARLKAFEQQLSLETKLRAEALGRIIEADRHRDYETALAAIYGSRPSENVA